MLLAALALFVAGCGGDDGGDSASSDTAIVETESSDDDATETESADDGTETDATEDDGELGGECAEFAGLGSKLQSAFGSGSGDIDSVSEAFDELADRVPEEIRDDYQVLADDFREFVGGARGRRPVERRDAGRRDAGEAPGGGYLHGRAGGPAGEREHRGVGRGELLAAAVGRS